MVLIKRHRVDLARGRLSFADGYLYDDICERITRADHQGFDEERIGRVHFDASGFFGQIQWFRLEWNTF